MKRDAKEHEAEDKTKKEEIEVKNQADAMVFQGEKQIKEFEAKLNPETRSKIQAAIDRLKEAIKSNVTAEIKSAMEQYNKAWEEASTQMYSQAKGQGGADPNQQAGSGGQHSAGPDAGKPADDGKVENADYEVVDDKK